MLCALRCRCTRPDCSYLHTSPRRMPYQQQQQQQHQPPPVPMATMFPPQPPVFAPSTVCYQKNVFSSNINFFVCVLLLQFSYVPGGPSPQWPRPPSRSPRFPKKSALTWTPTKHIRYRSCTPVDLFMEKVVTCVCLCMFCSERAFAVPDKQSTSLPAKQ